MSSKIFITGSSDGLGLLAAQALVQRGHAVTLHARNESRAEDARRGCPGAEDVLVADLANMDETKALAARLNELGPWDAVVHNAGIMWPRPGGDRSKNELFFVNTLAPYVLTCLVDPPPKRYVFLSSIMHQGGDPSLRNIEASGYGTTKLHNIMLAGWFVRYFQAGGKDVGCSSMHPGWVPTKMGGPSATDDIQKSVALYVFLTEGSSKEYKGDGRYWSDGKEARHLAAADSHDRQDKLVEMLKGISGVAPPK